MSARNCLPRLPLTSALTVRVPASSANLGPGFDCLGLALPLYLAVTLTPQDAPNVRVSISGEGAERLPRNRSHTVFRCAEQFAAHYGYSLEGVQVHCHSEIPLARGLGSSAAAIVAGHYATFMSIPEGERGNVEDLAGRVTAAEGHPDNVMAALYGGVRASIYEPETGFFSSLPLAFHPDIRILVAIAQRPVATSVARTLLPQMVPHREAVRQAARLVHLVEALKSRPDMLFAATEDFLHQRYRAEVMPESWRLFEAWRQAGIPAVISGAGPTVLAFLRAESEGRCAREIAQDHAFSPCHSLREFEIDAEGAKVVGS